MRSQFWERIFYLRKNKNFKLFIIYYEDFAVFIGFLGVKTRFFERILEKIKGVLGYE